MNDLPSRIERALSAEPFLRFIPAFLEAFPEADLYLVGGAVRDIMLGRKTTDFDFVVRGLKRERLEGWFEARGRLDLTGRVFGVYKFSPNYQLPATSYQLLPPVDIALPRTETSVAGSLGGYRDFDTQSNPDLPIEADLARRDFTINAFAFDVRRRLLTDAYGGQRDLDARLVRAVGVPRERFLEDLSRLLRGIRFAVQLGFEIDAATWEATCEIMPEANRTRTRPDGGSEFVLPRETVGRELAKAFTASPERAAHLLLTSGALERFLPEAALAARMDQERLLAPLKHRPSLPVTLALLLRNATPEAAKRALDRAGLSSLPRESALRAAAEDVAWIVRGLQNIPTPEMIRTMAGHDIERIFMNERGHLFLEALAALDRHDVSDAAKERMESFYELCRVPASRRDEPIPLLATGADILALGMAPGPQVRALLDSLRDAQFAGHVQTKEEAKEWIKKHA